MSLDLGKTLGQLQAAMGDVAETVRMRRRRFADRIVQGWNVSPDEARARTESAGVTEFIVAGREQRVCWPAYRRRPSPMIGRRFQWMVRTLMSTVICRCRVT